MLRLDLARPKVIFTLLLLGFFFTASLGGVTAGNLPQANSSQTAALAAKPKKQPRPPTRLLRLSHPRRLQVLFLRI